MAVVYMPRKAGLIWMLVLGAICFPDGIVKGNPIETLVGLGTLTYSIVSLVSDYRKKQKMKKNAG